MSYYVAARTGGGAGQRFRVYERKGWEKPEGVVKTFDARQVRGNPFALLRHEPDREVRGRAQQFADRLNAGGATRERTLQEAQAPGRAAG